MTPPTRAEGRQAGFTMIEVMVAILLTALTLIGVLGLFRIETQAASVSRRETEASVLAQDKLEELRTLATPAGPTTGDDGGPIDAFGDPGGIFTRTWEIYTPLGGDGSVLNVKVRVEWDADGHNRSVEVVGQRGAT